MDDIEQIVQDFVQFCDERLKLENIPEIELMSDPSFSTTHSSFGAYHPGQDYLQVSIAGRHIMDVLRTIAHELVHHKQHEMQVQERLAFKEYEANFYGSMLIRMYGKQNPELFNSH